jgi:hypothetical protein
LGKDPAHLSQRYQPGRLEGINLPVFYAEAYICIVGRLILKDVTFNLNHAQGQPLRPLRAALTMTSRHVTQILLTAIVVSTIVHCLVFASVDV